MNISNSNVEILNKYIITKKVHRKCNEGAICQVCNLFASTMGGILRLPRLNFFIPIVKNIVESIEQFNDGVGKQVIKILNRARPIHRYYNMF